MAMAETVRRKIREMEPRRSVFEIHPLTSVISDSFGENRLRTILLGFFALTAIALACVGLYGTLSYLVNVRQREVGLRMALGALRGQVVRQFLKQGLTVAAIGCAAGLALAMAFSRVLAGMLYGVSAWDGETLAAVAILVLAVAGLASLAPSMRAARLDPMRVLRDE
jgi:putative ABC transport system permease protein